MKRSKQCWLPNGKCQKPYTAQFKIKLGRGAFEGRFCDEHFKPAFEEIYRDWVKAFYANHTPEAK